MALELEKQMAICGNEYMKGNQLVVVVSAVNNAN